MIIQFFSEFSKKTNSTKRPTGTVDRSLSGVLKENCSIQDPVINIERLPQDVNPCVYTYAIIPQFQRFYFVEDWVWNNGLWEVHMTEDVLATWKTAIGASTEYVLRTNSTTDFNGEITDTTYPATNDYTYRETFMPSVFPSDITVGCYIVGIISGTDSNSVGAISYFAMNSTEFDAFKDMLFSDGNLSIMDILDTSVTPPVSLIPGVPAELLKTMYNPYQYIASCMWFPFPKSAITDSYPVQSFKIGWWGYPLSANLLYAQTLDFGEMVGIHQHPQAPTRGKYLNYAPYTRRTLMGRFGCVAIDNAFFVETDQIGVTYTVDLITGQCRAVIEKWYVDEQQQNRNLGITERHFLLGVPIQIAQVGTDYLGTAVNAIDTAKSAVSGALGGFSVGGVVGAVAGAIASSASGIYNTLQSAMPQVETGGMNGSFIAPATQTALIEHYAQIVDEDIEHRGRPLCELRRLDTLDGFILCADGELDISCFDNERKAIQQFLTTGFFWE